VLVVQQRKKPNDAASLDQGTAKLIKDFEVLRGEIRSTIEMKEGKAEPKTVFSKGAAPSPADSSRRLDDLVGCYSTRQGGEPEIKLFKRQGKYLISMAQDEAVATETTQESVVRLFDDQATFVSAGASAGALAIFKVRPGMSLQGDQVTGGYVVILPLGARAVFKVRCPGE